MEAQCWKYDSSLLPLPWRSVDEKGKGLGYDAWSGEGGKLRVGIMRDDGHVRPVGSINRALEGAIVALGKAGVECVDVEPKFFKESWELVVGPRTWYGGSSS
jgi:amidase